MRTQKKFLITEPGLVLWLPFDGDLRDYSGYENFGTNYGASWETGPKGLDLNFDGLNDYVLISSSMILNITNSLTIQAWINPASIVGTHRLIGKIVTAPASDGYFLLQNTKYIQFGIRKTGDAYNALSTATVSVGSWYHIAGVYDGANVKVYVNAMEKIGNAYTDAVGTNTEYLRIGTYLPAMSDYFKGIVGEVRIYNRALDPSEIWDLYQRYL